jgi:hypothetical protein
MAILVDIALLSWPLVCMAFFLNTTPTRATLYSLLGSMMLLPMREGYDFPGLPFVGKEEIATLGVIMGLIVAAPARLTGAAPFGRKDAAIWILLLGCFATALTNSDPLTWGIREGTKLAAYDGLAYAVSDTLRFALPFIIGRALFTTRRDLRELLLFLGVAGLLYSIVALIEMRLSPQFHDWVYGYHQINFRNVYRLGGYRPKGFMWNGLAFSLFILASAIALSVLHKAKIPIPPTSFFSQHAGKYQTAIMILCRSLGTIIYGAVTLPIVWWGGSRAVIRVATLLTVLVIIYPALRITDTFPTDFLVEQANRIDEARGQSLGFRFENEDLLIQKALERPLLGWGGGGRARVYDEFDGHDITITDGTWIIRLGMRGVVGWVGTFALLLLPIWRARKCLPKLDDERDRIQLAGLALIVAVYSVDLLPNALFSNLPIFLGGALYGITGNIARMPSKQSRRRGHLPLPRRNERHLFDGGKPEPAEQRPKRPERANGVLWTRGKSPSPLDRKP